MLRRCPTPLTMLVAAVAFGLGLQPTPNQAQAASSNPPSSATYSITTPSNLDLPAFSSSAWAAITSNTPASAAVPQLQFELNPPQSLVNYNPSTTGPLAGSISGLDSSNAVKLGLLTNQSTGEQILGLFIQNGLNGGSALQLPLYYNTSTPPTLIPLTAGVNVSISSSGSTTTGGSQTSGTGGGGIIPEAQTPEPFSLLIWAALAGGALARVRFLRPVALGN